MTNTPRQRRPKGSGSLRHISGNRWQVTVKNGRRRHSRVFTARNATEANKTADALRVELRQDCERRVDTADVERAQRQAWTVEQYIAYYFREWAPYHLANTTRERYSQITKNQVIPHIGRMRMSEVTPADLTAMYAALATKGSRRYGGTLSGQTIWTVHSVMRAIFTFAVDIQGDFERSPAGSKAARPNVDRHGRTPRALDVSEVEQFVSLARDKAPDIAVPIMLAAYLGTRRGETLALRWCDLDLRKSEVTVSRSVTQTTSEGVTIKSTKTGRQRTIPLDAHTVGELKSIQRAQREQRLRLGPAGWRGAASPAEDYIAANMIGELIEPDFFANSFRTLTKQNKLTHITPHVLRHAWVSQMIALGFDAVTIATMTGHSPDVLMRTYAHAFDKRKREAVEALGEARKAARSGG